MSNRAIHPNLGSSGVLRHVASLLQGHPEGLTTTEILVLGGSREPFRTAGGDGPKAAYLRVKRAIDGLVRLGFIIPNGHKESCGRKQQRYAVNPSAMENALREVLRQALDEVEDRIRNQFPLADAAALVAAFEDVIDTDAERLGLVRRPRTLNLAAMDIRKRPPDGGE